MSGFRNRWTIRKRYGSWVVRHGDRELAAVGSWREAMWIIANEARKDDR